MTRLDRDAEAGDFQELDVVFAVPERDHPFEVDPERRTVHRNGSPVSLTPMEFDLLLALLRRNGTVVSRLDLLQEVWGHSAAVLTRTVDTHVAELRRKLERDPAAPEFILTARKAGYRLEVRAGGTPT